MDLKQLERIQSLVECGKKDGGIFYGGRRRGEKVHSSRRSTVAQHSVNVEQGAFMEPTILVDVTTSSKAYQEEIFGPVVIVNSFDSEEGALQEANCTEFGLFCEFEISNEVLHANILPRPCTPRTLSVHSASPKRWTEELLASTARYPCEPSTCRLEDGNSLGLVES